MSATSDQHGVLDGAALDQLASELGGEDVLADVVEIYLDNAPARIDAVTTAVTAGGAEELERAAHALKGASGMLGAVRVQQLAGELEDASREPELHAAAVAAGELPARVRDLAEALDEACAALAARIGRDPAGT